MLGEFIIVLIVAKCIVNIGTLEATGIKIDGLNSSKVYCKWLIK